MRRHKTRPNTPKKAELVEELNTLRRQLARSQSAERKRKATEAALRESEPTYRTLVEQIPAVSFIAALDNASTTLYVSPQVQDLLGYSQS